MNTFHRRRLLQSAVAGAAGISASGWLPGLARALETSQQERRHCVVLWMSGGPSQTDTFDMKPGHENGGEFSEIATGAPGLRFCEHLPQLAKHADQMAVIRSLSTKEGDHGRGTFLVRTGQAPGAPIQYPTIAASMAKEMGSRHDEMPNYVSISPYRAFNPAAFGPGFLGPSHGALTVGAVDVFQQANNVAEDGYAQLAVDDLLRSEKVTAQQALARNELWDDLQGRFLRQHQTAAADAHDTVHRGAMGLMESAAADAFDLDQEPDEVRQRYGRGRFGQGCLLARRLIENGVGCVEVSLGAFGGGSIGWDTHANNFTSVRSLCEELDAGWATLMSELQDRDLLESTTFLWIGEFGRTPQINRSGGRDHYPQAWSCVLAGGGIAGGQAYGLTSSDGTTVEEDPVAIGDVLATLCQAAGVDPDIQNISEMGRPIRIAEGTPINAILR